MRTRALAAAPLAAVIALAGCGGGGGDNSSSSSSSGASVTAFCDKAKELQQLGSTFQDLSLNDLSAAKDAFQQTEQKLQEVDDVATAEVKSSADKVLSVFKDINSAIQGASSPQDLRKSAQDLVSEVGDLQSALTDLRTYGRDHCKGL
jgi:hypothetical protein